MFGRPIGRASRLLMKAGNCVIIFCCIDIMDDELSTMTRMSTLPAPAVAARVTDSVFASGPGGAHPTAPSSARPIIRVDAAFEIPRLTFDGRRIAHPYSAIEM